MKNILTSFALLSIASSAFSQNCCNMVLKDGAKTTLNITTFANTETKDSKILAFNEEVIAGRVTPASNYDMSFSVKKTPLTNGDEYAIGYKVGEVDYFSYVVCSRDTVFSARNRGPVPVGTPENPIGYSLQGIQIFPMNMKVGDVLPSFEDIGIGFPTTADVTLKKKIFLGYVMDHSRDWGFGTDSRTGQSGWGSWDVYKPRAIFKNIDVDAKKTVNVSSHAIQGVNQRVTGEEEVTVSGVKYKAFIIECESWSKTNIKTSYESADEELNKAQVEADKRLLSMMEKFQVRRQYTNKQGYFVMYSKQWVVPQLGGAVKTIAYDAQGAVSTIMTITKIE